MRGVTISFLFAGMMLAGSSLSAYPQDSAASPSSDELFHKGYCFDTGECAAKNEKEAVKWYTLAAKNGQAEAQRNLAGMYSSGRGVKKSETEARRLFLLSAAGGDAQGQYELARWFSKDKDEQIKYLKMAVAQNHVEAIAFLKSLQGVPSGIEMQIATISTEASANDLILDSNNRFTFKISCKAPEQHVAMIKLGLAIAQLHLAKNYGGAIPEKIQKGMRVRIDASGHGDSKEGGGSPAATTLTTGSPRLYFDVIHRDWNPDTNGRGWTTVADNTKVAVHEYTHAWHFTLSGNKNPFGQWIDEGIAEFVAYDAMIAAGQISKANVDRFMLDGAKQSNETSRPLKSYTRSPVWPGHVGYAAINWLVDESPNGKMSIRILATEFAAGKSTKEAFIKAFNIEPDSFYLQFEKWRALIQSSTVEAALANRPTLKNLGE